MTAKINNGTTETQTRLVRWKRRVLGFEGAAVTPYSPISHGRFPTVFTRGKVGDQASALAKGPKTMRAVALFSRIPLECSAIAATLPFNYNSCGLLPFFRSFYVWRWSVFGSPRPPTCGGCYVRPSRRFARGNTRRSIA